MSNPIAAEPAYKQKSMEWEYCPSCSGELDTGFECLACGRDWRPWAMAFEGVTETEAEQ